jgi:hypothetical protein
MWGKGSLIKHLRDKYDTKKQIEIKKSVIIVSLLHPLFKRTSKSRMLTDSADDSLLTVDRQIRQQRTILQTPGWWS